LTFRSAYAQRSERVSALLHKILNEGFSEENVHDIRTSIRRLQSALKVLPGSIRKKKNLGRYIDSCTDLFKILNEVRDCDVILSRLSKYPEEIEALKGAKSFVIKKRTNLVQRARRKAISLEHLKNPQIRDFPESKFNKRYEARLEKQAKKVKDDLSVVWTGKAKKNEIHELRIDCKKFRYALELDEKAYEKQLEILKEWQGYLGTIHDIEMTQEILRKANRKGTLDSFIRAEEIDSLKNYNSFIKKSRTEAYSVINLLSSSVTKT
jgi:CHAD domain-containing protein